MGNLLTHHGGSTQTYCSTLEFGFGIYSHCSSHFPSSSFSFYHHLQSPSFKIANHFRYHRLPYSSSTCSTSNIKSLPSTQDQRVLVHLYIMMSFLSTAYCHLKGQGGLPSLLQARESVDLAKEESRKVRLFCKGLENFREILYKEPVVSDDSSIS